MKKKVYTVYFKCNTIRTHRIEIQAETEEQAVELVKSGLFDYDDAEYNTDHIGAIYDVESVGELT
jgi:hypothetical protein